MPPAVRQSRALMWIAVVTLVVVAVMTLKPAPQDAPSFAAGLFASVAVPEVHRTAAHDRADAFIAALLSQAQKHRQRGFENAAVGSEDFAALLAWSAYTPRRDHTPLQVVKIKVLHPSVFKVTVALPASPQAVAAGHGALLAPPGAGAAAGKRGSAAKKSAAAKNPSANGSAGGSSGGGDAATNGMRQSTFVLKSECRPALPYDGQQALGEIGAAFVLESIFGPTAAYGPYGWVNGARGVVVEVTPQQFGSMLSRGGEAGRCGLLTGWDLSAAEIHKDRWERIHFAGAALQWNPVHYDDAMPHPDSMEYFTLPRLDELNVATALPAVSSGASSQRRHPALAKDPAELEALRQMSDVLVVDFVAQSSDRVDHNWFRTAGATADVEALVRSEKNLKEVAPTSYGFPSTAELAGATEDKRKRFHSGKHFDVAEKPQVADMSTRTSRMLYMDNGWAFAGLAFVHSVCDADTGDLRVPRTLRFFNGTPACDTYSTDLSTCPPPKLERPPWPLCRFRRTTVEQLKSLSARWGFAPVDAAAAGGGGGAAADTHSTGVQWAEILREDPLMRMLIRRYRNSADVIGGQPFRRGGMQPLNVVLSRFTQDCPVIGSPGVADAADLLALGVGRRLRALTGHIDWCVETYGSDEVLL